VSGATSITVTGNPTPEELAAVVAVLAARPAGAPEEEAAPVSRWNDRAAALRTPLHPGPGAWHAAG
jgi:hypothetical protein